MTAVARTRSAGADLRRRMEQGTVVAAGAFMPFVARLVEEAGFGAIYVSGGALSNSLARPDEGLLPRHRFLSLTRDIVDVVELPVIVDVDTGFGAIYVSGGALSNSLARPDEGLLPRHRFLSLTRDIVEVVDLPVIVDVDTGFGGPQGTAQTVELFEKAGAAAVQIEDQDPRWKRCGHLEGKHLISGERMAEKIAAAVSARSDPDFVIIARTDARSIEGLDTAIERARAYIEAGADVVFPEAPESRQEFVAFREALPVPLLANMTEFGKSPWITDAEFSEMKYDIVIHPVTPFRLTALAVKEALAEMRQSGNQAGLVAAGKLMDRREIDSYLRSE